MDILREACGHKIFHRRYKREDEDEREEQRDKHGSGDKSSITKKEKRKRDRKALRIYDKTLFSLQFSIIFFML